MRLLRFPDLKTEKGVPYTRAHLDRLEKDGKFPQRVRLSSRTVAWVEEEIDAHLAAKLAERGSCTLAASFDLTAAAQSDSPQCVHLPRKAWERRNDGEPQ